MKLQYRNHKERPTITNIKHGSVAQKSHCLSDGDVILSIREFDTKGMSKKDVKRYFKDSNPRLNMKVEYVTREACFGYCRIYSSQRMFLALRKVNGTFGFVLRKSSELLEYPVISSIKHGSPADREGILMDGDRLLEVDNQNLSWIPLAEAVSFLQNKDEVLLLIEYNVGIIDLTEEKDTHLEITCPDANLGMTVVNDENSKMIISFIQQGSLAQRCGVFQVQDEILSINGVDVKTMSSTKANDLLRRFRKGFGKLTFLHKGKNTKLETSVCQATSKSECSSQTFSSSLPVPPNSWSSSYYDPIPEDDFFKVMENYKTQNDYQLKIMSILKDIQMNVGNIQQSLPNETSDIIQDASLSRDEINTNESYQSDKNSELEKLKGQFDLLLNLTHALLIRVIKNSARMNHNFCNDAQVRTQQSEDPIIGDKCTIEFIDAVNDIASRRLVSKTSAKKLIQAVVEINRNCRLCVNEFYAASFAVRKVHLLLSLNNTTQQEYNTIRHVMKRVCQLPLPCHDCMLRFGTESTTEAQTCQTVPKVENNLIAPRTRGVGASSSSPDSTKYTPNEIRSTSDSQALSEAQVGLNLSQQTVMYSLRRSENTNAKTTNSEPFNSSGVTNLSISPFENAKQCCSARYDQDAIIYPVYNQTGMRCDSNRDNIYENDKHSRPSSTLTNDCMVSSTLTSLTEADRQRGILNEDGQSLSSIRPINAFERHSTPLPETPARKPLCQCKSSMGFEVHAEEPMAGTSHKSDGHLVKTSAKKANFTTHHTDRQEVLLKAENGAFGFILGYSSLLMDDENRVPIIFAIKPYSSAHKCGLLKKGDRILALNGYGTVGMSIGELESLQREVFNIDEVVMTVEFDVMDAEDRWGTFTLHLETCLKLGLVMDEPKYPSFVRGVVKGSSSHRSGQLFAGDEILSFSTLKEDTLNLQTMTMRKTKTHQLTVLREKNNERKKEANNKLFDLPFNHNSFVQSGPQFNIKRTSIRTIEGLEGQDKLVLEQDFTLFRDPLTWDFGFLFGENPKTGNAYITDIRPGGPADNSKIIKKYDRIIEVNGVLVDKTAENSVMNMFMKTEDSVNLVTRRVLRYR
ncbi:uncharacterized protein [Parasteatoda tepidariorum]|uniref:uncharacterized protein isoform X2 n=1 Tax=Parasteatoda tepidariorum TaxID=114398 RepID=UPI0039BC95A0